ncbi:MAG: chalcone isomerase family protein [Candidatus Thiodiazotropha sp.]
MKRRSVLMVCVCLLLISGQSGHATGVQLAGHPTLLPVGSGTLTWWGVTLYEATLLAPDAHYRPDTPYALQIAYRYRFSREQLARATLKEIERLQGKRDDRQALLDRFSALFTDVSAGDQITGVHLPGQGADFYGPQGYLGRLQDPQLAAAFFDIWLDPRTREPDLRRQLLGALE